MYLFSKLWEISYNKLISYSDFLEFFFFFFFQLLSWILKIYKYPGVSAILLFGKIKISCVVKCPFSHCCSFWIEPLSITDVLKCCFCLIPSLHTKVLKLMLVGIQNLPFPGLFFSPPKFGEFELFILDSLLTCTWTPYH